MHQRERYYPDVTARTPDTLRAEMRGLGSLNRHRTPSEVAAEVEVLREDLQSQPSSADSWNALGVLLAEIGHFSDAIAAFDRARLLQPGHVDADANGRDLLAIRRARQTQAGCTFAVLNASPPDYQHSAGLVE